MAASELPYTASRTSTARFFASGHASDLEMQLSMHRKLLAFALCLAAAQTCGGLLAQIGPIRLDDATATFGDSFMHQDGNDGQSYLYQLMSAGLATFDYDNDGYTDAYFLNGGHSTSQPIHMGNALLQLRYTGSNTQFRDVSRAAGLDYRGVGLGVAVTDFNNDGFEDVYVSNFGNNLLFQNNGDGTFSDVTDVAQVADGQKFGAGPVFADFDSDGDADLFCGNYVNFSLELFERKQPTAFPFPPGPKDFPPTPDSYFVNNGDGTFDDQSIPSGIASVSGPSMGAVAVDADSDGDLDIFVCCDGAPNHLFVNDGVGNFEEQGVIAGVAYDSIGVANGSMGADAGDLNADGIEDLFVTDFADQHPMLFMSQGAGFFDDEARRRGAGGNLFPHVNWGAGLIDLDNDTDLDLFIANGHFLKNTSRTHPQTSYAVPNSVLENSGHGRFEQVDGAAAQATLAPQSSRGVAIEDFNQDGLLDILILNNAAESQILLNQTNSGHNWLEVSLVGTSSNRSAIGARVTIRLDGVETSGRVHSGRGYQSHFGTRLHFGLANHDSVPTLEVLWPDGQIQTLNAVQPNQRLTIVQTPE